VQALKGEAFGVCFFLIRRLLAATLARLELNEEIPESLFRSVAIVLAWVYRLQGKTPW
jgi:type III secretion system FlhB-like substrate exporter